MVGPAEGAFGGIAALVETLTPLLHSRVELRYLPTAPIGRASRDAGRLSLRNLGSALSQFFRFADALFRFRPEIIHLHSSQGIAWLKDSFFVWAGKGTGKRVVVHFHASTFEALYGERCDVERWYTRLVLRSTDALIAVSETWRHRLGELASIDRIHTFANCIDAAAMEIGGTGNDHIGPIKAVFLGSIGERKGVLDLIRALRALQARGGQLAVDIAGYEDTEGYLMLMQNAIDHAGIGETVRYVGPVRGKEKRKLLADASIFVLPSYNEGLPIALLEAMAAGCAVVTTPVGGIPEVITDGQNGFLVDPGDVQSLADRIQILVADDALRNAMGETNRTIALQELDVARYVDRLVNLYEKLAPELRREW